MKKLKVLFIIILILLISGCNQVDPADNSAYIQWESVSTEYELYDTVPNWEDYFMIPSNIEYEKVEVNSDFDFTSTFDQVGEFSVQVKLTLADGSVVYDTLDITVVEGEFANKDAGYYLGAINNLISSISSNEYFQYDYKMDIDISIDETRITTSMVSSIKEYVSNTTNENISHALTTMNINGELTNIEMAMMFKDNTLFTAQRIDDSEWHLTPENISQVDDYGNAESIIFETVNNVSDLSIEMKDELVYAYVTISEDDLSEASEEINALLDMLGIPMSLDVSEFTEYVLSIQLAYVFDSGTNEFIRVELDYTDFINQIIGDMNDGSTQQIDYERYIITISDVSFDSFDYEFPVVSPLITGYSKAGHGEINLDGLLRDVTFDPDNNYVYYTIADNPYVYALNYKTFETKQIYYSILPDQLYYRDDKLYVTLSDEHFYYNSDPEYGGLGVIDTTSFTKIDEFDLNFDPYDIVVDEDGFAYITHGSNQHGILRSINTNTGVVVGFLSGFYHGGEVHYSDYTKRLYYVELGTTKDDLEVYEVYRGDFGQSKTGSDKFEEHNLSMSPNGYTIISNDGYIFNLNNSLALDGMKSSTKIKANEGVAWDLANDILYVAHLDGIYAYDDEFEIIDIYSYSNTSQGIFYDEGIIISSTDRMIEIIDTVNTNDVTTVEVVNVSYGETFDLEEYLDDMFIGEFEGHLVSGSVDDTVLGNYQIIYHISSLENEDVDIDILFSVSVGDFLEPTITLDDETSFEVEVGSTFTPPACSATDNYDESVSCHVVENNVDPEVLGSYAVTYQSIDSSGNVTTKEYTFTVLMPQLNYNLNSVDITGLIGDAVADPEQNAVYYIKADTREVVKYDLSSGSETAISFTNLPEKLLLQDGKLYVSIVHGEHSYYWWEEDQTGEIGIIDTETYTLDSVNWVTVDPFDMAVIDGYIYIFPGSGQWVQIVSYNLSDFTERQSSCSIRQATVISYDRNSNYIFGITTDSSPQSLERYTVSNGLCTARLDDPGHGDYHYGDDIFAFANSYVFSENGQAFTQVNLATTSALDFVSDFGFQINAFYYNHDTIDFLYGDSSGFVKIANGEYYPNYEVNIGYGVDKIFGDQNTFYVVSYYSGGLYIVTATKAID